MDEEREEQQHQVSYREFTSDSFLFQLLDAKGQGEVLALAQRIRFRAGDTIVQQDDPGGTAYLVREGKLSVTTVQDDEEIFLGVLEPGVLFGEVAEAHHVPRTATVKAITDVELLCFDGSRLLAVFQQCPAAERALQEMIRHRAEDLIRRLVVRQGEGRVGFGG